MHISAIKTSLFRQGDSLEDFINLHIPILQNGDIIAVTSKICALAENRIRNRNTLHTHIIQESQEVIETPWAILTRTTHGWCINAGIDTSNADTCIILLPKNPFKTAEKLRQKLMKQHTLTKLGVIITDTRSTPLRVGTLGKAIGYAGFKPIQSYIGKKDLFGRKSRVTESNVVDALAGIVVYSMGEGNEQTPLALIHDSPVIFTTKPLTQKEMKLFLLPENDIFSFVYTTNASKRHTRSKKNN